MHHTVLLSGSVLVKVNTRAYNSVLVCLFVCLFSEEPLLQNLLMANLHNN